MPDLLVLDVGGTYIKYGVADDNGKLYPGSVSQLPSCADGKKEEILGAFAGVIDRVRESYRIGKACISIAGPFDFEHGVSLMQHKFPALYQVSLRDVFEQKNVESVFLHDSTSFILGEYAGGGLSGSRNGCCVMLGTGLGFAAMRDGKVLVNDRQTPAITLWNSPWKNGTAEDYVSTRALQRLWGDKVPVLSIANAAREGNEKAINAFTETGKELSAMLAPLLERLKCDRFVLGGQIAKSADLFDLKINVPWTVTERPEDAALLGACYFAAVGKEQCTAVPESI